MALKVAALASSVVVAALGLATWFWSTKTSWKHVLHTITNRNKSDEQHQDAACEVPGKEERLEAEVIALKTERDEVKEEISKVKCELHAANERIARLESALAEARSITESVTTAAPLRKKGVNFFWAKAL